MEDDGASMLFVSLKLRRETVKGMGKKKVKKKKLIGAVKPEILLPSQPYLYLKN